MSTIDPYVARLLLYPFKSLDGVDCDRVTVIDSGALQGDRRWAIFDQQGNFVNGKRNKKIHALRSQYDLAADVLTIQIPGGEASSFKLTESLGTLQCWLGDYFSFPVEIKQNLQTGFPDDLASPGPTIISTATLAAIADWYPELNTDDIRRRFRANIEIDGVPAFWEDRLFTVPEQMIDFKLGEVKFNGVNPCQRCIVVTRDPKTGQPYPKFQQTFIQQRKNTLPEWTERSRFNHYFRLAINTRVSSSEAGKVIRIGDQVSISQ